MYERTDNRGRNVRPLIDLEDDLDENIFLCDTSIARLNKKDAKRQTHRRGSEIIYSRCS